MAVNDFAHEINKSRTVVYDIFERETMDTGLLYKISEVLNYDFFPLYKPQAKTPNVEDPQVEYSNKLNACQEKVATLKREISYLQEINDLLKGKGNS